jgi:hypothetical protein
VGADADDVAAARQALEQQRVALLGRARLDHAHDLGRTRGRSLFTIFVIRMSRSGRRRGPE